MTILPLYRRRVYQQSETLQMFVVYNSLHFHLIWCVLGLLIIEHIVMIFEILQPHCVYWEDMIELLAM